MSRSDHLERLVQRYIDGIANEAELAELTRLLVEEPAAAHLFCELTEIDVLVENWMQDAEKVRAGDHLLAALQLDEEPGHGRAATTSCRNSGPPLPIPSRYVRWRRSLAAVVLNPIALLLLGFAVAGIAVYSLPTRKPEPVVQQTPASDPAAKIVSAPDAVWGGAQPPESETLLSGQRLILQSGSAQIRFNSQARVMLEGPAELIVVSAVACRLSTGRLTAHVPEPAKGFAVHTPDGTVTDLGTEFGVYVRNETTGVRLEEVGEEEQQPVGGPQQDSKQPAITEVHVFKGKVDVSRSAGTAAQPWSGNRKSDTDAIAQNPTSDPRPPTSTILSAGQAATISQQKVEPLPAADPFKFALDKLQGKPRQVLLSEDFETYDVGNKLPAIGPWLVQSGTRKGQGIHVYDPRAKLAEMTADVANPVVNLSPAPAIGSRVAFIAASAQNPRDTFPLLAREIDGKVLMKNCQVLVEFDYMPLGPSPQFSVALAAEAGHVPGIELWKDVDATKTIGCPGYQWYRLRILLDVADGVVREARAERWHWLSSQGWVRDITYQPPTPQLDWSTPPKYAMFGFPVVSPDTPAGNFWLDNVRIEVIADK